MLLALVLDTLHHHHAPVAHRPPLTITTATYTPSFICSDDDALRAAVLRPAARDRQAVRTCSTWRRRQCLTRSRRPPATSMERTPAEVPSGRSPAIEPPSRVRCVVNGESGYVLLANVLFLSTTRAEAVKCVVPPGESDCLQCQRAGSECVIKNDDERRRPISRAYMSSLTDRVAMLEDMLKESGTDPPPVVYPPKTTRGTLYADGDESPARQPSQQHQPLKHDSSTTEDPSPASNADEGLDDSHVGSIASNDGQRARSDKEGSVGTPLDDRKDGLVSRLLSTRGHLSFDQLSGRIRFFGGTVNCHVYSDHDVDEAKGDWESQEQARRAERFIRALPLETHDYLMHLFWEHYNGVLHVVHEDAFNEDRENGRLQFYSGFLHMCILAMGFRFADKSRPDIQRIALQDRESTLHREAKFMLDLELERPGGITSIAALLILGDSEVGVGRDTVGWMYSGMAMRLCYDLGLQLDSRSAGLSERENEIRRVTLWACVIYDRYWSLFLGRPLTMKSADLEIYSLSAQFERLGACMPAGQGHSLHTRIYEALIDLMEIAGKIVEQQEFRKQFCSGENPEQKAYFKMATLDRELHNWAARLPSDLRYTEENRAKAPLSFYLLHQQYNAVLILLHRPFARYDDSSASDNEDLSTLDYNFSRSSRTICTKSAITMARIFWQHRQKFDGKKIFCIAMQHAGSAATALVAALASDTAERNSNMPHLEVLHAALQDMAEAYQPAERMAAVLNAVMVELRGGPISPTSGNIPARRGSTTIEAERGATKRRQTNRSVNDSRSMQPPPTPSGPFWSGGEPTTKPTLPSETHLGDYGMPTPQTHNQFWPNIPTSGDCPNQQHPMVPHAEVPTLSSPGRRQEWINQLGNDFPHVPQPATADMPGGDMGSLDFLHLPSEEDWARWHAIPPTGDAATDLDGYPPRGRYQPGTFEVPPMGGTMHG